MCYAILKIAYRNDKERKTVEVRERVMLDDKIAEQKQKTEVTKIEVFICNHVISKQETWDESPYKELEKSA